MDGCYANASELILSRTSMENLTMTGPINQRVIPSGQNGTETAFVEKTSLIDNCLQQTIAEIFEEQVNRNPDAVAIAYEEVELTYRELNQHSNQLGHYLRKHGVAPGDRVGICVERSLDLIIGLLGILKAGGAYVPLDPNYPAERLDFMVKDSEIKILLLQTKFAQKIGAPESKLVFLDKEWHTIAQESRENPPSRCTSDHPA
jgi:non-ribosomal peptide synthetase component F